MERFLDEQMADIADLNKRDKTQGWKYKTFHTILANDFNHIPENFTAVFLRGTPVQIVPDSCIQAIKLISVRGFFHENNESRFVCFYDANSTEGDKVYREIIDFVIKWMNANL